MKFAITIGTYQRSDGKTPFYLKRALNSIFAQKHQDFKIYLIGDKYENEDELLSIVNEYPKEKIYCENLSVAVEREKYVNDKHALWCSGGNNAVNHALDVILKDNFSHYICQLDHDDYWTKKHLHVFNEVIEETNVDWMCTKSTHIGNRVLPDVITNKKYIEFLPEPGKLINSSTCMNFTTIPIRTRDVFAEDGGRPYPSDADKWKRVSKHIKENNLKSYFINSLTCMHDMERH
jgi:hypothetical protein